MAQTRGPFPLPQTSPQICGVAEVVELVSGGVYVLPPGNYLISFSQTTTTVLQWFDPIAETWRPMAGQAYYVVNGDGANYRLYNMSGAVTGITFSSAGASGTNGIGPVQTGSSIGFSAATVGVNQALNTAQGYVIIGGSVPAPTVTQGGSGFAAVPIVCCYPPPIGGVQATFSAATSGGAIVGVSVINPGAGYTSIPQFYIIPQPLYYTGMPRWPGDGVIARWPAPGLVHPNNVWAGSIYQPNISITGALLTGNALTGSGSITGVNVFYPGGGYPTATPPTITIAGGPLTGAVLTASVELAPQNDVSWVQAMVI